MSSGRKRTIPCGNLNLHKGSKSSRNGKYVGKNKEVFSDVWNLFKTYLFIAKHSNNVCGMRAELECKTTAAHRLKEDK